jgi:hypothetical protein
MKRFFCASLEGPDPFLYVSLTNIAKPVSDFHKKRQKFSILRFNLHFSLKRKDGWCGVNAGTAGSSGVSC